MCTRSDVPEQRRKDDDDDGYPHGVHGQVVRLPSFEVRGRSALPEKANVENSGPRAIDKGDKVYTQYGGVMISLLVPFRPWELSTSIRHPRNQSNVASTPLVTSLRVTGTRTTL